MNEERPLIIEMRKRIWVEHALRRECLLRNYLKETVEGHQKQRRRRRKILDDLKNRA